MAAPVGAKDSSLLAVPTVNPAAQEVDEEAPDDFSLIHMAESYRQATQEAPSVAINLADGALAGSMSPVDDGKDPLNEPPSREVSAGDETPPQQKPPYDVVSLWSRWTFSYVRPLLRVGYTRSLEHGDLPPISHRDDPKYVADGLGREWKRACAACGGHTTKWTLWRAIVRAQRGAVLLSGLYAALEAATFIGQPVILRYFLNWLTDDTLPVDYGLGWGLAVAMVVTSLLQALTHHLLYFQTMRLGWNLRIGFIALLHNKLLRVAGSPASGRVINLVSTDVTRFDYFCPALHYFWTAPVTVAIVCYLISVRIDWVATLAGLAVMVIVIAINTRFSKEFARRRKRTASQTDQRVRTMAEVLKGMLSVKAFCWEDSFAADIARIRAREASSIRVSQAMKAVNLGLFFVAPTLTSMVIFLVARARGDEFNLSTVLSSVALVNVLRTAIGKNFARFTETAPQAHITVKRIQSFLESPEIPGGSFPAPTKPGLVVQVNDASLQWREAKEVVVGGKSQAKVDSGDKIGLAAQSAVLEHLTLEAGPGSLVMVGGPVGSGKTAILQTLLGELEPAAEGTVQRQGSAAFVAQSPWIMAGSLRSNILFGLAFDDAWYWKVIDACALATDLDQLPDGDATEIGERGVNLSGGQKARVALARAVYSRADLMLLDDPLSAVDPAVAKHIMDNCILGLLQVSTVVLVTHHLHFFSHASDILLVSPGGVVTHCASLDEVEKLWPEVSRPDSEPPRAGAKSHPQHGSQRKDVATTKTTVDESVKPVVHVPNRNHEEAKGKKAAAAVAGETSRTDTVGLGLPSSGSAEASDSARRATKVIVLPEDRKMGQISRSTVLDYLRHGGFLRFSIVGVLFLGGQAMLISTDFWLQGWAKQPPATQAESFYTHGYVGLVVGTTVIGFTRAILFFASTLQANTGLHNEAVGRVLRAPMSFFTSNPLGRILNRFSADLGQVDEDFPNSLFTTLQLATFAVGSLVVVAIAVPWILLFIPILLGLLVVIRQYAVRSLRELKRLDSTSRSPVYAAYTASLSGLISVRAFGQSEARQRQFEKLLDANARAWFWWLLGNRWIGFRLDMLSTSIVMFSMIFGVALRSQMSPGVLGVALVYVMSLSGLFQFMVRQSALVETFLTSVERLLFYGKNIDVEEDAPVASERDHGTKDGGGQEGGVNSWPQGGSIAVADLSVRYRSDLPEVIHRLSFTVPAGSKVGIVGRTGSGKSSLIQALFRLNEVTSGTIMIDGIDTSTLALRSLRSRLSFIPQEPVLFTGTLRYNLDPFHRCADADLWAALEGVGMRSAVDGLDMRVTENGQNISTGQRQLVSLARAMLLGNKVVVMDEATANVDYATDDQVQRTLRDAHVFREATILIIAHRIKTIADADYVAVLDGGSVVEFGPPQQLIAAGGTFAGMVAASGSG